MSLKKFVDNATYDSAKLGYFADYAAIFRSEPNASSVQERLEPGLGPAFPIEAFAKPQGASRIARRYVECHAISRLPCTRCLRQISRRRQRVFVGSVLSPRCRALTGGVCVRQLAELCRRAQASRTRVPAPLRASIPSHTRVGRSVHNKLQQTSLSLGRLVFAHNICYGIMISVGNSIAKSGDKRFLRIV
jgi:hypothetical protein